MKKIELIWREMLYQAMEEGNRELTQLQIAEKLNTSLSTVNHAIKPLRKMGAVEVKPRLMKILEPKKILYHWASNRNPEKDIIYATRVNTPVKEIESHMPDDIVYGAYTAYKHTFDDVPADYSEVYVYGTEPLNERFPENKNPPNLYVLKQEGPDYGKTTTIAHTFTDLWNLREWYAQEFIKNLEEKINGVLQ